MAAQSLEIEPFMLETDIEACKGSLDEIIKQYESHPSILKIRENVKSGEKFTFKDIDPKDISQRINDLAPEKAGVENDIPAKILKGSINIVSRNLADIYNKSKTAYMYPSSLKCGTVIPIRKQDTQTLLKKDYRPISLIPIVSKIYEKGMHGQIYTYVEKYLPPYLFGFRKNHSTAQCLTIMIEMWKKGLEQKQIAGAVTTDLPKAFDCLNHSLLLAKLNAYGFEKSALSFIYDYLKERKQRTKINNSYSVWANIIYGAPQVSTLGLLLFNLFINVIFLFFKRKQILQITLTITPFIHLKMI